MDCLLLSSRCMPNYPKTCSFLMFIALKHKKVIVKFVKKVYGEKHSFIELTYVVGAHWNCL